LFVINGFSFAQNRYETRKEKLEQLKTRTDIKVTEIEKDILKLEYPHGKALYKNIADYQYQASSIQQPVYSPNYDSTIIDLTTIDTTLYYHKYSFWQEVPLTNLDFNYLRISDVNNNGKPELYGRRKFFNFDAEPITIYELSDSDIFEEIFQYDSVIFMKSIYDVDKDGNFEIHTLGQYIDSVDSNTYNLVNVFPFFKKSSDTSLAKEISFVFEPWRSNNSQQNDNYLGDWDGDEFIDQIFIVPCCPSRVNIYEYNPIIPNFDSVFQFDYSSLDLYYGGFAIGDFDDDGNTEFFAGSIHGKVLAIENCGNNCYAPVWQGIVETYNAYLLSETDDLDKNGKKEIWIGGDAYYNGIGTTRITIFETDGDNSYQTVGRIDLVGVMSFYAGNIQTIDIDKDGTDEVMICIDDNFLILKFNGSTNHHTYEVYYIKKNELITEEEYQVYFGATMYDLLNNGEYEILISIAHTIQVPYLRSRGITKIYKPDSLTSVISNDDIIPNKIMLNQNYPNPFNPSTKIGFEISQLSKVTLKVFNILGKEIITLLDKELSPGNYNIDWEAKDSNGSLLSAGVYLIKLCAYNQSGNYTQIIKALLLK
jgi:hypothetical protein